MRRKRHIKKDNLMFHLMLLVPVIILFIYNILPIPAGNGGATMLW